MNRFPKGIFYKEAEIDTPLLVTGKDKTTRRRGLKDSFSGSNFL